MVASCADFAEALAVVSIGHTRSPCTLRGHPRLCCQGPVATGMGSDWSGWGASQLIYLKCIAKLGYGVFACHISSNYTTDLGIVT